MDVPSVESEIDRLLATKSWSLNTRDRYRRALQLFLCEIKSTKSLTATELRRWLEKRNWSNSTMWIHANAIRAYLRWKFGQNHPALLLRLPKIDSPPGRCLKLEQVQTLMASFNTQTVKGRRDLAMCALLLDSGLRVSELCSLDLDRVDLDARSLYVLVKGGQWESGTYSPYTAMCMATWLADRELIIRPGIKAIFAGTKGGSLGNRLTRYGVRCIVREWGKKIGIKLSPHDFRRSFATIATRLGAPQQIAMAAGRWKSEKVFERYTKDIKASDIDPYSPVMAAMDY